ncbi:MAG: metal-dependent hydrolase [Nanoarchaeota archaeon]
MLWRTHILITLFFCLCLIQYFEEKILLIFIALFATLIPDIDSSDSKLGKNKIFLPLQLFTKHRGFFHSLVFLVILCLLIILFFPLLNKSILFGLIIGYSSHLIADALTIQGIAFFYPFSRKRIRGFIRTSGFFEWILFFVFLILNGFLIYKYIS